MPKNNSTNFAEEVERKELLIRIRKLELKLSQSKEYRELVGLKTELERRNNEFKERIKTEMVK